MFRPLAGSSVVRRVCPDQEEEQIETPRFGVGGTNRQWECVTGCLPCIRIIKEPLYTAFQDLWILKLGAGRIAILVLFMRTPMHGSSSPVTCQSSPGWVARESHGQDLPRNSTLTPCCDAEKEIRRTHFMEAPAKIVVMAAFVGMRPSRHCGFIVVIRCYEKGNLQKRAFGGFLTVSER